MKRLKFEEGIIEHAQTDFYLPKEKLKDGLKQRQEKYLSLLQQVGMQSVNDWLGKNGKQVDEVLVGLFNRCYG